MRPLSHLFDNNRARSERIRRNDPEFFARLSRQQRPRYRELNVIEQVAHVCQTTVVRDAWGRGQALAVHGRVYGLQDGLVRDLGTTALGPADAAAGYHAALAAL